MCVCFFLFLCVCVFVSGCMCVGVFGMEGVGVFVCVCMPVEWNGAVLMLIRSPGSWELREAIPSFEPR